MIRLESESEKMVRLQLFLAALLFSFFFLVGLGLSLGFCGWLDGNCPPSPSPKELALIRLSTIGLSRPVEVLPFGKH